MKDQGEGIPMIAVLVIVLAALLIIGIIAYGVLSFVTNTGAAPFLIAGMLGNPFRTTRKMKVPYHSRRGHSERKYLLFAEIVIAIALLALVSLALASIL